PPGDASYQALAAFPVDIPAICALQSHMHIFFRHLITDGTRSEIRKWQDTLVLAFSNQTTLIFSKIENRECFDFLQLLMPHIALEQVIPVPILTGLFELP